MTPQERLYWLGFERASTHAIRAKGCGALLAALVRTAPKPVNANSVVPSYRTEAGHLKASSVKIGISQLRSALEDVGFPDAIETVPSEYGVHWGGYRIASDKAEKIKAFVENHG